MAVIQVCDICRVELERPPRTYVDIVVNKKRDFPLPEMIRLTICEDCFKKYISATLIDDVEKELDGQVDLSKVINRVECEDE